MAATISLTNDQTLQALGDFITALLGIEVIVGEDNRVAEPSAADYAVMTPVLQQRISTNMTDYQDCLFMGSIVGKVLTITDLFFGSVVIGMQLFGPGILAGTLIQSQGSIAGTYNINRSQTIGLSRLSAGRRGT